MNECTPLGGGGSAAEEAAGNGGNALEMVIGKYYKAGAYTRPLFSST